MFVSDSVFSSLSQSPLLPPVLSDSLPQTKYFFFCGFKWTQMQFPMWLTNPPWLHYWSFDYIAAVLSLSAHDASLRTVCSPSLSQPVSNTVGNESSESMREMCGCVRFSVSAKAQVYASQSSWNAQELEETPHHSKPIPSPFASLPTILTYLFTSSLYAVTRRCLPLSVPLRQVFWTETKERCSSSCGCELVRVKPSQRNGLEQRKWAWSRHRADPMRKTPVREAKSARD